MGAREKGRRGALCFRVLGVALTLSPLLPFPLSSAHAQRTAAPAELAARVAAVLDDPALADAHWGALAVDLQTGDTLFARNARRRFIPASNEKLFPTAAALALLGPGFRYETALYLDGEVRDGTLDGDLVLRGSGDPTLGSGRFGEGSLDVFRAWADSLRALGVARVAGRVVGDDDVFDDVPYGLGWAWDDLTYGYGAEVSGLTFREGTVELSVRGTRPGGAALLAWEPLLTPYVAFDNRTRTRPASAEVEEGYARQLSGNRFTVTAEVPAGAVETEVLAVHNPTLYAAHTLRLVLLAEGIAVEGPAVDVDELDERPAYGGLRRAASKRSPPLGAVVQETNRTSQNLYAEHLLRTLGVLRYRGSETAPGSANAGVLALFPFLSDAGIAPGSLQLVDGSGLSVMNRVTPLALVQLLAHLHRHPDAAVRAAFYDSLPVGGQSGTLAGRFQAGAARGNVRAKTGYLSGVRALSGYVTTAAGHTVAFSLIANHYGAPTARVNAAQDAVVELLADYAGR
jgi:D-alanyl-D-alanine carboxypeptidase/D-alanyl-D-alanine-endopeptidase (penicillin-binding protein 4)